MLGKRTGGRADRRTVGPDGCAGWRSLLSGIRRMTGMPDYAGYCEHLRRSHPEASLPSERQFYEDFVRSRYGDGPTRCC
jgi:uncharacterized short protein YbdD (DUF466 family)